MHTHYPLGALPPSQSYVRGALHRASGEEFFEVRADRSLDILPVVEADMDGARCVHVRENVQSVGHVCVRGHMCA